MKHNKKNYIILRVFRLWNLEHKKDYILKNHYNLKIKKMKKFPIILICMFLTSIFLFGQKNDTIKLKTFEINGIRATNKTPISKITLNEKNIENSYYSQELPLLLGKSPNITTSTDGGHNQGYVYFRLRGIDQTRINMTLNGIPLNEPEDQGVYFSNYPDFTTSIKSIQIQRGIGTSSNGVTSYGGSINIESKQGFNKKTEIQSGIGSFNTNRFSIENSSGMMNKMAFYTRLSLFKTDGYKYHSGNKGSSFFIHGGYYGEKNIIKTISFTGNSINQMTWYGVHKDDIKKDPKTNYNTDRESDDFKQTLVSLIYTRKLTNNSNITSTVYYNKLDGNWILDYQNPEQDTLQNYKLNHNFYGFISNYNYKNENSNLNFGIHINKYNREHSSEYISPYTNLYINNGYKNDFSSFAKYQYNINKITYFADIQLRHTSFDYKGDVEMDKINWLFFNPKFGITYSLNNNLDLYTSIGKTNREPTRTDMFGGEDNLIQIQDVVPESVIDCELGLNYNKEKIKIHSNLYYMNFKNELTHNGLIGENALPIMKNVKKSYRSGIELDFIWNIYKTYGIIIRYTNNSCYSHNKIKDNNKTFTPLYTPNFIMNNILYIKNQNHHIIFDNKIQSKSYIDWENKHDVNGFYTFNIGYGWNFFKKNSIKINNITNQQYFTNGNVDKLYRSLNVLPTEYLFVNPPINWFITLKIVYWKNKQTNN